MLVARGLSVRYPGGIQALSDLNLEVPRGGITCLLGANGAGKTTLLETASGLTQPTSGSLTVLGSPAGSAANRLSVGVMVQDGGLPGSARPREFLDYLARLYPDPRNVREVLDMVDIDPSTRTPMRRMSGGQLRRIAWAAAMIGNPRALLLDEPTAGLDPLGREELYRVLRRECNNGVGMIVSTHVIEDVHNLADTIVVIRDGQLVLMGHPRDLRPNNRLIIRSDHSVDLAPVVHALPAGVTCTPASSGRYYLDIPGEIDAAVLATVSAWCAHNSATVDIADLGSTLWDALRGEHISGVQPS